MKTICKFFIGTIVLMGITFSLNLAAASPSQKVIKIKKSKRDKKVLGLRKLPEGYEFDFVKDKNKCSIWKGRKQVVRRVSVSACNDAAKVKGDSSTLPKKWEYTRTESGRCMLWDENSAPIVEVGDVFCS